MKKINEVPIVLHTMDSYSQYWDYWYLFFKKYVTNHGTIYFLSEEKEPSFIDDVIHIKTGKGEWGYRLLEGLKQINEDLIIYLQEDFWAYKDFNLSDDLLKIFYEYKMDHLVIKELSHLTSRVKIKDNLYKMTQNSNYTHNHQFAIWKKDKLVSNVLPNENPWINEVEGTKRLNKTPHNVYILEFPWYISVSRKGQLMIRGVKLLEKHNLPYNNFKIQTI